MFHLHAGNTRIAELLISHGATVNILDENKYSPLAYAIYYGKKSGNFSMAKLLIEHEADVNEISKGETLLMLAAKFGDFQFESNDFQRFKTVFCSFFSSFATGLVDASKILIDNGADVNAVNNKIDLDTALHAITRTRSINDPNKQYAIAELLINSGADLNAKNKLGDTPVSLASNDKSNFIIYCRS